MYEINNVDQIDSPNLLVFPDLVRYNIDLAVEIVGDADKLMPHIKTHKTIEVIKMCQESGIQKFKCATIAEAEILGMCGAKKVLMAYQPVGIKIKRFLDLCSKYPETHFSCLIDTKDMIKVFAEVSRFFNQQINVFIDINSGMNRTGISPEKAFFLAKEIVETPELNLLGLHVYDGHIRDVDFIKRKEKCDTAFDTISNLRSEIEEELHITLELIVGGSPTFPIHSTRENVICSPGTFVFWDYGYQQTCPEQKFQPAILIVTRIISIPDEYTICTDLGHKSVAAENSIDKRVHFINASELEAVGQSEEHLILKSTRAHNFKVGDVLFGLPYHVCPTIALHQELHLVKDREISPEVWEVLARNRRIAV